MSIYVNAAVKIHLSLLRRDRRRKNTQAALSIRELELRRDLARLTNCMTQEEFTEYQKRIA